MVEIKEEIEKLLKKDRYDYSDLCEIMRILRSENGCPWDREQTHESIRGDLIEETYEVVEAIDNGDRKLLREELGDLLLQVVFHAEIEAEAGCFSHSDVENDICLKLIHRHPHVFGDVTAETSAAVLNNWEIIKNEEKQRNTPSSTLKAIPKQYPALMRAQKVGKKAGKYGFDFPDAESAKTKIYEELDEFDSAPQGEKREEEFGDLLLSVVNYGRKCGIDCEKALSFATDKFIRRFTSVEQKLAENGVLMADCTPERLDDEWNSVKMNEKVQKK